MGNSPSVVKPEITTPESSKRLAATSSLNTPSRSFRYPSKDISGAVSTSSSSHSSAYIIIFFSGRIFQRNAPEEVLWVP
ncbi:hypothetical protein C4D60_Mb07t07790 [Musa balbisiana]|uniref:Uncharacterized protein n=1 Tax=Musa balbisiana TaxID=52838 RepID=A0A4S8JDP6_MUSBA|nr:hypothetical protein C4D60_Mb07t07790 [Musa balbisiana]